MAMQDVKLTRLSNGTTVVSSRMPHVESVSLGIWVGTGGRYERAEDSGISHFIEHLLFKGTRKRSAMEISCAIEGRGGYLNAFTQEEATCYYVRVAYDQLAKALDVLCDMYCAPRLAADDVAKERGVILEELLMYRDQPQHVVQEAVSASLWRDHPLGRSLIGTPETLAGINRTKLAEHKRAHYVPSNTIIALAGKLEHARCVDLVAGLMQGRKPGRKPTPHRVTSDTGQDRISVEGRDIEQSHVALGIRLFGYRDAKRYSLRILSAMLGENMSSRLFQVVREKHGLAYSIHSQCHLFRESGALLISAGLDRKKTAHALSLIVREIRKFKERAVGPAELKRAKDYVIGQIRLGLESTTHQMMWLGDNMVSLGKFVGPGEIMEGIQAVRAEDVQSLAVSALKTRSVSLAIVAPPAVTNELASIRQSISSL